MSEAAPTNTMGGGSVDVTVKPLIISKRWASAQEFEVPHDAYIKARYGRDLGSKWADFIEDEDLRNAVRNAYHKDGKVILTSSMQGSSVIVRKHRHNKMANSNDI